ncbi:MAG: hypothetical protein IPN42_13280 [Methylococcaceae bacterium]|nr:hypothetical protein [Methylococcaceae bacterium]
MPVLGLYIFSYDNSAKFAETLLFEKGDNDQLITSVLNLRFPAGTQVGEVERLVKSISKYSRCKTEKPGKMICSFGLRGVICSATTIEITVDMTNDEKIKHLNAKSKGNFC